jgi:hypothetical protein
MVLGVTVFDFTSGGLVRTSWFLPEYGPAVAGLGANSGRLLAGLIGAADIPACDFPNVSALDRVAETVAVLAEVVVTPDEPDTVRTGDTAAMAEPGRGGKFFAVRALFWAIMVSLSEGLELVPIVLFEKPSPGRGAGSDLTVAFGLCGSFCNNFWAVPSRPSMILSHAVSDRKSLNVCRDKLTSQPAQAKWQRTSSRFLAYAL